MAPSGEIPSGESVGIPYTLMRPEFVVTRDGSGADVKYSVKPSYVPDPDQRYTLRVSPSLLADVQFEMALNDLGGISSVEGHQTDEVLPTLKALADLVISVAKAAPAKGLASFRSSATEQSRLMDLTLIRFADTSPFASCKHPEWALGWRAVCVVEVLKTKAVCGSGSDLENIRLEIEGHYVTPLLGNETKDEEDKAKKKDDKADFGQSFAYRSDSERVCLTLAGAKVADAVGSDLKANLDKVDAWIVTDKNDEIATTFDTRLKKLLSKADSDGAARLVRALDVATKLTQEGYEEARWRRLKRELSLSVDGSLLASRVQEWNDRAIAVGLGGAKPLIAAEGSLAEVARAFAAIATVKPDVWRARRLANYDKLIEECALALQTRQTRCGELTSQYNGQPSLEWARLNEARGSLLGLAAEYKRYHTLESRLNRLPQAKAMPHASPFDEYGKQRAEADRLKALLDTRAEQVAGAGKGKEATPPAVLIAQRTYPTCIAASQNWDAGDKAAAPDFVVVLRPLGHSADREKPMLPEECP
ncbi:MAG: hypothetical protein GC190_21760 [Alphaproteobacteria bacterium]|nr:hypothetical protein [Alphaproteobacteria bacterium]